MSTWLQWGISFLLSFAVMASAGGASYWLLRSDHDFCRFLRELSLFIYAVLAFLASIFTLFSGGLPLWGVLVGFIVFWAALQTPLEKAINPLRLTWGEEFTLALITYFYTFCNSLVLGIVLIFLGFLAGSQLRPVTNILGLFAGVWLTPISISFFRWMISSLPQRPGLDRALEQDEAEALRNSDEK